jgi:hypothetical protein
MWFTQYLRPHGRPQEVEIARPADIEQLAAAVRVRGFAFEIEVLTTGEINMDCCNEDEQLCCEVCDNGPQVPDAVDRLVRQAHKILEERLFGAQVEG